jgi:hypothetical protein
MVVKILNSETAREAERVAIYPHRPQPEVTPLIVMKCYNKSEDRKRRLLNLLATITKLSKIKHILILILLDLNSRKYLSFSLG